MEMQIIDPIKAGALRADFIKAFVDTSTEYYCELEKVKPTDTVCDHYVSRYLRDTLFWENTSAVPFRRAAEAVRGKARVYSMWDIRPGDVQYPSFPGLAAMTYHHLEKYGSDTVIEWDAGELADLLEGELGDYAGTDCTENTLPEDVYIFDGSFEWCVIFTHSESANEAGERLCYICRGRESEA